MTRLTKEEIAAMRNWACATGVPEERMRRALDELEEHRAREGNGVTLSEDAVEEIRAALEMACVRPAPTYLGRYHDALALLPPKREPTLLEAAKDVAEFCGSDDGTPLFDAIEALRAAIERESKR